MAVKKSEVSSMEGVSLNKEAKAGAQRKKKATDYKPSDFISYVAEFQVPYVANPHYTDEINLLKRSREGLSAKSALDFLERSGFSHDEFQQVFKTTVKTIQNHVAKQQILDAALSEKLLKLAALFDLGAEVFGSATYFNQWIHNAAFGLGYQVPLEMMETITGIKLVEDQLLRVAYGDLA